MIDFSAVKAISIAEGVVKKIVAAGKTLWEAIKFTNQVPISIDTDGSIYNGTGYKDGYRLSSSGVEKTSNYSTVTGYIPVTGGEVIRINFPWYSTTSSLNYICAYDASFGFLYAGTSQGSYSSTSIFGSVVQDGDVTVITLKNVTNMAYIRLSYYGGADGNLNVTGADMIVTLDEEIAA